MYTIDYIMDGKIIDRMERRSADSVDRVARLWQAKGYGVQVRGRNGFLIYQLEEPRSNGTVSNQGGSR